MTNKFFDYLQPTIVKTTNHPQLAENLRNRYFLNFNILGIRYFEQYYLLKESVDHIPYLIMKEDDFGIELEESLDDYFDKILDIPRIYINISSKFINDSDTFRDFFYQAIMENAIYSGGIEGFRPGEDYWLNTTLYNYLANTNQIGSPNFASRMPNFLTDVPNISEYFEDLSTSPYKDYMNLEYYERKNALVDNKYSEDELKDFYKNFCSIILEQTLIDGETRMSNNNQIYEIVLKYFAGNMSDEPSRALNLLLNNLYSTTDSKGSSCTCNSSLNGLSNTSNSSIASKTCFQLYEESLLEYAKTMLGDINFYNDWFNIPLSEWDSEVNDVLIINLIEFVKEFLEIDFVIDSNRTLPIHDSINCNHVFTTSTSDSNKTIIQNYLKVLEFVESKQLVPNTNRIKIWGSKFGELLPTLQFN